MQPEQFQVATESLDGDEQNIVTPEPVVSTYTKNKQRKSLLWLWVLLPILSILAATAVIIFLHKRSNKQPNQTNNEQIQPIKQQDIDLNKLGPMTKVMATETNRVTINGEIRTNSSIVLEPTEKPAVATIGQVYFDEEADQIRFFNGNEFQTLLASNTQILSRQDVLNLIDQSRIVLPQLLTLADIASFEPMPQDLRVTASPQFAGLRLQNGSGTITLQSSASNNNITLTLPSNTGLLNQCMLTNGTGVLSFGSCSSGVGNAFIQGGNAFGTSGVIGTTDNQDLKIVSNNTTLANFASSGQVTIQAAPSMNGAFQVLGNYAMPVLTVGTQFGQYGAVGIGTTGPGAKLHVVQQGSNNTPALRVSNSAATAPIAVFSDDSIDVMVVNDGGSVLLQNSINSSGAFSIRDQVGNLVVNVNTVAGTLGVTGKSSNSALTATNTSGTAITGLTSLASSYALSGSGFGSGGGVQGLGFNLPGVFASSASSVSGLFQTWDTSGTNLSATLVTKANTAQTADLLQAQDSTGAVLANIDINGNGSFSGTVSGADAININQFVTKGQLDTAISGTGDLLQNGNSFGVPLTLGTNDGNALNLETNNVTRFQVGVSASVLTGQGNSILTSTGNLTVQSASADTLTLDSGTTGAINIGTSANAKTVTVGNKTGTSALVLQAGVNGITLDGVTTLTGDYAYALTVRNSLLNNILTVDTTNGRVGVNVSSPSGAALEVGGALRLSTGQTDTFITPKGSSVNTKINIPLFAVSAYEQLLAIGLDLTSSSNARAISAFDGRTNTNNQPTISVFNVAENDVVGLGWDGGNSTAYLKTMGSNVGIRSSTTDIATFLASGNMGINNTNPANRLNINTLTIADNSAQLAVATNSTNNKGIVVQGAIGQTADLFQAQSSSGVALASISFSGKLTVTSAIINGDLTVNGHMISGNTSGTTTIAAGTAACTSPAVSISGNDTAGTITVDSGTGCSGAGTGVMATITFANSYGSAPRVVLTPASWRASGIEYFNETTSTTTFTLDTNVPLTDSSTYKFNYMVVQ